MDWRKQQTIVFPGPRHAVIVTKYSFSKLPCSWWCVNDSQCSHVQDHIDRVFLDQFHLLEGGGARRDKTGADFVTFFWSSLSVFLIGPHTPATLGCWPGSSVWTNQKKVVKKSFQSSSNISKPNSAPKRCDRIGAGFIATWGPWWFPSCHDAVISRKDPRSNVPAPATTSQPDEYKMRWQ